MCLCIPHINILMAEQIFLKFVSTSTEELLDGGVAAPVWRAESAAVEIRRADHVAPSVRGGFRSLRRRAAVARSVWFTRGLRPWSLVYHGT
jgi:hypothetical protein